MQRFFMGALIVQLLFFAGCTITEKTRQKSDRNEVVVEQKKVEVPEDKSVPGTVYTTFLDTINEGNELVLTENDFDKGSRQRAQDVSTVVSAGATEPRYRVQVFASNRIETVREQKKELEKKIAEQIVIGYEAPYYKLYTGSYSKRQDAQTILIKLKKIGFIDAWIVSTNVIPEN